MNQQTKDTQARVDSALDKMFEALKGGKSEALTAYLKLASRFHKYSLNNQIAIWTQCPEATQVAGFNTWKKLGRSVVKGAKAIWIFAPCPYKKEDKDGKIKTGMFFKTVPVFDISQTEGDDLPEPTRTVNGDPGEALEALELFATKQGIDVKFVDKIASHPTANGISSGGHIEVKIRDCKGAMFSTLAHEIAHELLHQGDAKKVGTQTQIETEAELVAYIVCDFFGVDSTEKAKDYVQAWGADVTEFRKVLGTVQATAKIIIDGTDLMVHGLAERDSLCA